MLIFSREVFAVTMATTGVGKRPVSAIPIENAALAIHLVFTAQLVPSALTSIERMARHNSRTIQCHRIDDDVCLSETYYFIRGIYYIARLLIFFIVSSSK